MTSVKKANLYLALLHYPVYDTRGRVVTSALTNLDIHDIARAVKTFGVAQYYVVTPLKKQHILAQRILAHWRSGFGAQYNPKRKEALELVAVSCALTDVIEDIKVQWGIEPKTIVADANPSARTTDYPEMKRLIDAGTEPYLLLLGTGWGITEDVIQNSDFVLEPIRGNTNYYHLSVRSAAAIILDRLLGNRESIKKQ